MRGPDRRHSSLELRDRAVRGLGDVHRRAVEPPERIVPVAGVLFHSGDHLRMGCLDEQRSDPADERRGIADHPPRHRVRPEQPRIAPVFERVFERLRAVGEQRRRRSHDPVAHAAHPPLLPVAACNRQDTTTAGLGMPQGPHQAHLDMTTTAAFEPRIPRAPHLQLSRHPGRRRRRGVTGGRAPSDLSMGACARPQGDAEVTETGVFVAGSIVVFAVAWFIGYLRTRR